MQFDRDQIARSSSRALRALRSVGWTERRGFLLLALLGLLLAGGILLRGHLTPDCPDGRCPAVTELQDYRPPEPPHVYARDGTLAGHLPGPRRVAAPLERIPTVLEEGFVAVEDRRFRDHGGVDLRAALRALVRNLRAGGIVEGASTITMQLARNIFAAEVLDYSAWHRKTTEVRLALAIESRLSKSRILELYLNQIYLGDGVYGVATAARNFFDVPVSELTVSQAALLIGLAKNPEGYNPRRHPDRAVERRNVVLDVLAREEVVPEERAREAMDAPLNLSHSSLVWERGSYYAAAVRRELATILPDPRQRAGIRIHTALDPTLQAEAEKALKTQIRHIEEGRYGPYRHPVPGGGGTARTEGASPHLQGMVVALDASTGQVRALVGGRDFAATEFDRAFLARRQPGSAFKPIVLSTALSEGVSLASLVRIDSLSVPVSERPEDSLWHLADLEDRGPGENRVVRSVRDALVRSSNVAAVRLGTRAGMGNVIDRARALGIESPIPPYPALFLGTAEVAPAELVAAYAAFENGGYRVEPRLIRSVESPDGTVLWSAPPADPMPALDPRVAFLVRSVLEDVVDRGTGWRARSAGVQGPAAGKTGTTNEGKDVWFVGMRPGLVTGVWLGFDRPERIVPGATGGRLAAPVWGRLMAAVPDSIAAPEAAGTTGPLSGEEGPWAPPEGLVRAKVDASTGFLANESCPAEHVRTEHFLPGTPPTDVCPVHGRNFVDRIVGEIRSLFGEDDARELETIGSVEPPR